MGLGVWEIVVILVVVLLLFGPSRLPSLGKSLGEAIRGFKGGLNDNSRDVTDSNKIKESKENKDEEKKS